MYAADRERQDALAQDGLTTTEWTSLAVHQYAGVYGAENRDRPWILSPFDTWEPNPYYQGPPAKHPEEEADEYGRE